MFCLRVVLLSSAALLSCPFSCCAVRAPSSSPPAELTRPFFFCTSSRALGVHVVDGPNSLLHSLALSLAHATSLSPLFHRLLFVWSYWIVLSPSPSNLSNETEFTRHIFFHFFLLSFFLFSSSSPAQSTKIQSTKIWRGY